LEYTAFPTARKHLNNPRASTTFEFECNGLRYSATISQYPGGELAEIFLSNRKAGSHGDAAAKDSAIVCSLALQHGVPLETIKNAPLRDGNGRPSSPLGCVLYVISPNKGRER
jgi:ribonucleoside-diphosphate reductase alpha chain